MRVLFFIERGWPSLGGAEVLSLSLAAALAERGHQVEVLCDRHEPDLPECEEHQGVTLRRLSLKRPLASRQPGLVLRAQSEYRRAVEAFQPDLLHVHFFGPSAYFPSLYPHPKMVTTVHDPFGYSGAGLASKLYHLSRRVVAISHFVKERWEQQYPELKSRIVCIPNAVQPPPYPPGPAPLATPLRLLGLGRMVEDKGFDLLLKALDGLHGWQLDLVGEGPSRDGLQKRAQKMNLASVRFLGALSHSQALERMSRYHLMVVPSRWQECFGLVALEAMWQGLAVLAARSGALPEVVGEAGMIFDHLSVSSLHTALRRFLEEPELCRQLGEAGARRARAAFPFAGFVDAHLRLYAEVLC